MAQLLIICGPTATGKTDLAVSLARLLGGELISADSRQVYRRMDIGTGKDIAQDAPLHVANRTLHIGNDQVTVGYREKAGIPIWLVDMVDPDYTFHVADYVTAAHGVIADMHHRRKLPIVVGGTGFYIRSLLQPPATLRVPPDLVLRMRLEQATLASLQEELREKDKEKWEEMNTSDRSNPRRLIRAIEVAGVPLPVSLPQTSWQTLQIGLTAPLPQLYRRIDDRVEERYRQGILPEVTSLIADGYSWKLPSFSACGYDIWKPVVEGTASPQSVVEKWKRQEHAYAKRQLTWFAKEPRIEWFDSTTSDYKRQIREKVETWYTEDHEHADKN